MPVCFRGHCVCRTSAQLLNLAMNGRSKAWRADGAINGTQILAIMQYRVLQHVHTFRPPPRHGAARRFRELPHSSPVAKRELGYKFQLVNEHSRPNPLRRRMLISRGCAVPLANTRSLTRPCGKQGLKRGSGDFASARPGIHVRVRVDRDAPGWSDC